MEALFHAYPDSEDDDVHQSKRHKSIHQPAIAPIVPPPYIAGVPGRYVSRRERAAMAADSDAHTPAPPSHPSPELPSVLNAQLPHHVQRKLDRAKEDARARNRCPQKDRALKLQGHSKAVVAVRWSPTHGALLASGGMDAKAHIWNVWENPGKQMARCLSCHTHALKDIQWSLTGTSVLSSGLDQTARLSDVETGAQTQVSL